MHKNQVKTLHFGLKISSKLSGETQYCFISGICFTALLKPLALQWRKETQFFFQMPLPAKHNPGEDEHPKEYVFGLPFPCLCLRHLLSKEHLRKASSIPEINRNAKLIGKGEYTLVIILQWELSWRTYWTLRAELPITLHLCLATHLLCSSCPSCPRVSFYGNPWEHLITFFVRGKS